MARYTDDVLFGDIWRRPQLYAGWPSAVSALDVYDKVYKARNIDTDVLRRIAESLPPMTSEQARADATTAAFGAIAPRFAELTNDLVFDDLWRRSDLSVRDRSLVTIAALAAMRPDAHATRGARRARWRELPAVKRAPFPLGLYA